MAGSFVGSTLLADPANALSGGDDPGAGWRSACGCQAARGGDDGCARRRPRSARSRRGGRVPRLRQSARRRRSRPADGRRSDRRPRRGQLFDDGGARGQEDAGIREIVDVGNIWPSLRQPWSSPVNARWESPSRSTSAAGTLGHGKSISSAATRTGAATSVPALSTRSLELRHRRAHPGLCGAAAQSGRGGAPPSQPRSGGRTASGKENRVTATSGEGLGVRLCGAARR
jgi:hypothetical protein